MLPQTVDPCNDTNNSLACECEDDRVLFTTRRCIGWCTSKKRRCKRSQPRFNDSTLNLYTCHDHTPSRFAPPFFRVHSENTATDEKNFRWWPSSGHDPHPSTVPWEYTIESFEDKGFKIKLTPNGLKPITLQLDLRHAGVERDGEDEKWVEPIKWLKISPSGMLPDDKPKESIIFADRKTYVEMTNMVEGEKVWSHRMYILRKTVGPRTKNEDFPEDTSLQTFVKDVYLLCSMFQRPVYR